MTASASTKYPLERVLEIKKRRVEMAEKVVREKQELLRIEQEKLKAREIERDKVKKHRNDKMQQLRDELDQGTTTDKIQQMKIYLKVVEEKLVIEEKKVADQKAQVEVAEKNLELAKQELNKRRMEVDKLVQHKKDWTKEARKELEILEGREMDEIGNVIHSLNQRRRVE